MTALKRIQRIAVTVLGGTVLALGLALLVLPGPAFLVIPAGLAILAIEYAWAKRWLRKARGWLPEKSVRDNIGDPPVPKQNAASTANVPLGGCIHGQHGVIGKQTL